jgi:apolipoprotein N-acyltransferase
VGELKNKYLPCLVCFICGAIIPFGFAPYNKFYIPVLSLSLFFYIILNATPRQSLLYGYIFGLAMFGVGVNWLHISINLFGGVNLAGALFFTYALVAFIPIYPALSCYLAKRYISNHRVIVLLFALPSCWVIMEWCRSWIFTGFPWLNLGYSQIDSPLGALTPILGVYGASFLVLFSASLLVLTYCLKLKHKPIAIAILLSVWVVGNQMHAINWTTPTQTDVPIAMIQGGIKQEDKWKPEMREPSLKLYQSLTEAYWGYKLIIWPETAIPAYYHDVDELVNTLELKSEEYKTDLIVGAPVKDASSSDFYNGAILVNKYSENYHKQHLVPFGEYLPFDSLLRPILHWMRIPISSFSKGDQRPLMIANNMRIGISICYEDTFGEEVIDALPDAEVLVNLSNDAWFGDSWAPHQHLQMARMRALETGRYLLRATNTGISAVIDEKGRVVKQSRQFDHDTLAAEITLYEGSTPYVKTGNYSILILCMLLLILSYAFKSPDTDP